MLRNDARILIMLRALCPQWSLYGIGTQALLLGSAKKKLRSKTNGNTTYRGRPQPQIHRAVNIQKNKHTTSIVILKKKPIHQTTVHI